MAYRAAIAGIGMTAAMATHRQDRSNAELCQEAVWAAMDHAGITPSVLDALVVGNIDGFEGTVLGAKHLTRILGVGGDLPVTVINTGGTTGGNLVHVAARMVASGDREAVLCLGPASFFGARDLQAVINTNSPMVVEQPLGMGAVHMGAFFPAAYQERYGVTDEDLAHVVVQAHSHAARNPYAQLRNELTVEEVLTSRMISTPMVMAMICPATAAACAVLVTSERLAQSLRTPTVVIRALGSSADPYLGGGKGSFSAWEGLGILARRVYAQADIRDPRAELDVLELFAPYAPMLPMQLEALGFAGPGDGAKLVRSGATTFGGDIPTNMSGGPKCTNAGVAGELAPYAYVALQLMGDAPADIQVQQPVRGLAHGTGGTFFQFENLAILERTTPYA
ncbi:MULTISPECIES: thiolase family protein [unclassified Mycobacterium]|uniref:thiolase family protein n=1 Tax=unclassified Mycobacterium TaxID=2642494 RepID=UPI00048ECC3B|nr:MULTISPECIES: thiolase family protein [unclassified Mycobacterium]SEA61912.1 acetyl-CoA C-acetyltransferase [Mycobacterium sp. 283mftsu]